MAGARFLLLRRLGSDTRAVSAVEFAMILPFMLLLLLGSFDITRMLDTQSKISLLSRTVSDFVSQDKSVTPAMLANIVQASKSVLYPYSDSSSVLTIKVESIRKIDDQYKIDWSYYTNASPKSNATNRTTTITPTENSVIRADVSYVYNLQFAGFLLKRIGFDKITLKSSTAMSPRWGTPVEATSF